MSIDNVSKIDGKQVNSLQKYPTTNYNTPYVNSIMAKAKETSEKIKDGAREYVEQKDAEKELAEQEYNEALNNMYAMKNKQEKLLAILKNICINYGGNSTRYTQGLRDYMLAIKNVFGAETLWSIKMDKLNAANMSAFKAYLSTRV